MNYILFLARTLSKGLTVNIVNVVVEIARMSSNALKKEGNGTMPTVDVCVKVQSNFCI